MNSKDKSIVRKAIKYVTEGKVHWSCTAITRAQGVKVGSKSKLAVKFGDFYGFGPDMKNWGIDFTESGESFYPTKPGKGLMILRNGIPIQYLNKCEAIPLLNEVRGHRAMLMLLFLEAGGEL
jgi:hypothetical protein